MLSIVQDVCSRLALPRPTSVAGSSDAQSLQILGVLNEEGQELAARHPWQALTNEASFTTVATQSQGTLTSITGSAGFGYVIGETIWNRTQRRPVYGARSPQEWQQLQAQTLQGPFYQYRIRGNELLMVPIPSVGQSCYFEWITQYWALSSSGTEQASFANDADTTLLSERLLTLGAKWRFLQAKGLDYAEDYAKYEQAIADAMARDAVPARLNLDGMPPDYYPAVLVPSGSWAV